VLRPEYETNYLGFESYDLWITTYAASAGQNGVMSTEV